WVPSPPSLLPRGFQGDVGKIGSIDRSLASPAPNPALPVPRVAAADDVDTAALFAERQARLALLRGEGPRMLRAGNWRRAGELCQACSDLEFWNPTPRGGL